MRNQFNPYGIPTLAERGQANIGPNTPLNLQDFAQLYLGPTGSGDPREAASRLWFDAPREAQSHLEDQWNRLGLSQSPEQYFTDPRHVAALMAGATNSNQSLQSLQSGSTQVPPSVQVQPQIQGYPQTQGLQQVPGQYQGPTTGPFFQNELQRQTAMMLNDPSQMPSNFRSPSMIAYANAIPVAQQNDWLKSVQAGSRLLPFNPAETDPTKILQSQLAGDTSGSVAQVLRSLGPQASQVQNLSPEAAARGETYQQFGQPLHPYSPALGYGRIDPTQPSMDLLDRNVHNDPVFQKILAQDPAKGAFVYNRLTGRDYQSDIKTALDLQKSQEKTGYDFTQHQLENGAKYIPVTDSFKVWDQADAPVNPNGLPSISGQEPKPFRQYRDATPQENRWMKQHFKNVTGQDLPTAIHQDPDKIRAVNALVDSDPVLKAAVETRAKTMGQPLTVQDTISEIERTQAIQKAQRESDYTNSWTGIADKGYNAAIDAIKSDPVVAGIKDAVSPFSTPAWSKPFDWKDPSTWVQRNPEANLNPLTWTWGN